MKMRHGLAASLLALAWTMPAFAQEEAPAGGPIMDGRGKKISNGNENQLVIYGFVTRALLYADDGDQHQLFNVDGGAENTRVGWVATGKLNENVTVIGHVEMDTPLSNKSEDINLTGNEAVDSADWTIRIQEVAIAHKRFGKITLGQGETASAERVTADLSGSNLALSNNPADIAGGLHFYNKTARTRAVTIGDLFDDVDGNDKDDRIQYNLPEIGGLELAMSHTSAGSWDAGTTYERKVGPFELEAGAFYANVAAASTTQKAMWGGSGSIKHESGLSLTVAGAARNEKAAGRDASHYLWGKIGYSAGLFKIGQTHFGLSHGEYKNFAQNGDKATETGFGVVQDFESIGSNAWLLVRNHQLDRADNNDYGSIFIVSTGVLFNF